MIEPVYLWRFYFWWHGGAVWPPDWHGPFSCDACYFWFCVGPIELGVSKSRD